MRVQSAACSPLCGPALLHLSAQLDRVVLNMDPGQNSVMFLKRLHLGLMLWLS